MKRRGAGNRKQQIARALETILTAEGISKNIHLVTALWSNKEYLPLQQLISLRVFSSLNTQLWEIQNYMADSPNLSNFLTEDPTQIHIPFQITYTKLFIPNPPTSHINEIRNYVLMVNGRYGFNDIKPFSHGFSIAFQSVNNCFAFWRATKLVPFKGQHLKCEIMIRKYEKKVKKSESIAPYHYRRQNGPHPQYRNQEMHDLLRKHLSTPPPQPVKLHIEKPQQQKAKLGIVIKHSSSTDTKNEDENKNQQTNPNETSKEPDKK